MRKLISSILLLTISTLSAQIITSDDFTAPINTGANMTSLIASSSIDQFSGGQIGAFIDVDDDGQLECVGLQLIQTGFFGLSVWGDDTFTGYVDGLLDGQVPLFAIFFEENVIAVEFPQFTGYITNAVNNLNEVNLSMTACMDPSYLESIFVSNFYQDVEIIEGNCLTYISSASISSNQFLSPTNTGANMTIGVNTVDMNQFIGGQIGAFYDLDQDGILDCVGLETIQEGFFGLALWGDDSSLANLQGLPAGVSPIFAILYNDAVIAINESPTFTGYVTNGIVNITAFEFVQPFGCTNLLACNYNSNASVDDGSCVLPEEFYDCSGNCVSDIDGDGICDALEIPGCTDDHYVQYNPLATDLDDSCELLWQDAYLLSEEQVQSLSFNLDTLTEAYQVLLQSPNCDQIILIDLELGWNMFGYTSPEFNVEINSIFDPYDQHILLMKDNNGAQYWPEFEFNGIGDFIPGEGYLIKVSQGFQVQF